MKKINKSKENASEKINFRSEQILNDSSSFAVTEAYKTARTNLLYISNDDGCNIIAVTSSYPGEGKTITCINLAICLAQSGKKVLIIDSDMRKPQISETLNIQKAPGLSDLLAGFIKINDEEANCCRQKTHVENLDVISAGKTPPNPSELLSGNRLKELLAKLSAEYDYIMIDTPPTLVVADSMILKSHINGYIIVVRSDVSSVDMISETVSKLRHINAKICGFVLNGKKIKTDGRYSRYNKYGIYGTYGKYGKYSRYSRYTRYSKYGK